MPSVVMQCQQNSNILFGPQFYKSVFFPHVRVMQTLTVIYRPIAPLSVCALVLH